MTLKIRNLMFAVTASVAVLAGSAHAEDGVTASEVKFGQTAALDGPAAALGTGMRDGILAAFHEANAAGGVNGRQLALTSLDDGYEPDRAIANTQQLITEDHVFALIGAVGTPTSAATQPIATEAGIPFIGPFTGAGFLRDWANRNVINLRATYNQETEVWIERLTQDLGVTRIAILYQDDGFGRVGLSGVNAALEARGMELVAEGTYQRNTTAVREALLTIRAANPEAVVMVGSYAPVAEFIRLAHQVRLEAHFVNISFVGSRALADDLGADGAGVVVTQVVPYPGDTTIPVVAAYQNALSAAVPGAEPGFVSLEGYLVGRLTVEALKNVTGELTRESFLQAVYDTGVFDLDGVTYTFGEGDNQGSSDVFLTILQADGSYAPATSLAVIAH